MRTAMTMTRSYWLFAYFVALSGLALAQECQILSDGTEVCQEEKKECKDIGIDCAVLPDTNICKDDFEKYRRECPKFCLLCDQQLDDAIQNIYSAEPQKVAHGEFSESTLERIRESDRYMYENVYKNESMKEIRYDCNNRNELCSFWASIGECEANPAYMHMECAPACFTCHLLSFDSRCPFDRNAPTIWKPNTLDETFLRLVTEFQNNTPRVLSGPQRKYPDAEMDGPWIVVLDNFLNETECETLIDLGSIRGYEVSKDVGNKKFDGTYDAIQSKGRTSTNAWCIDDCYEHPVTNAVLARIEDLIMVPEANYEYLQLLRYEPGQFYQQHHDYIPHHIDRAQGVRILTVFLYLNNVEEGGGTHFPKYNLTIQPKRGRAVVWPSVLNESPDTKDHRTDHEALPVITGMKYGANTWVHQRDFKDPFKRNCI